MTESLDERALIERARRDPDAFAVLYRHYLNPIYRYLLIRLGNSQDAEDITAMVFTEALDGLIHERYREGGNFAAWLFTIARRRLIDYLRQRPTLHLEEIAVSDPNLIEQIQSSETQARLHELLSQMDEDKQELLRLRFAGGLSFAEIATLEGKSEAAVKMTVYRALGWLRENWEADNG